MSRYQRGKIYAIRSYKTDDVYIGSTCEPTLARRMAGHRTTFKTWKKNKKSYTSSYEILKHGDAYIELIENFPCDSKDELLRREGEAIRETDCVNKAIPGRTVAEYREETKELRVGYDRQRYQDNKEAIKAKTKQYYQVNIETINIKRKRYVCENREAILARQARWYQDNKKRISVKNAEKMVCPCGVSLRISDRARHLRTVKHKAYEATL